MAPSLALLTLAALTPPHHEVTLADENVKSLDLLDCPDLVAITCNVDGAARAYEIAAAYRRRGIPVVGGGIHVSAVPDEAGRHFDAICVGPAEALWTDILRHAQSGTLRAVYRSTQPLRGIDMPIPRRDMVRPGDYLYTNTVAASRGCRFKCDFCYNSCDYVDHRAVNRPVPEVIREIEDLGTRHILFIDDNFIGSPDWTRDFLVALRNTGKSFQWNAAVSADLLNHLDLLDLMAETGCNSLFIGFETINPESLVSVRKSQNRVERYEKLIDEIHGRKIMINASLVFGLDHDDASVFRATLDWLVSNRIETMTAHILTPYPGTRLHKEMLSAGRIIDTDHDHYNTSHVVYKPALLTSQELREGYLWMYKQFYSFKNIARRLPKNRRQMAPYLVFNLVYRKFGKTTALLARVGMLGWLGRVARRIAYQMG
jgi:radical SAM superfamily enzyme YgiQ (UPF0313 family)